MFVDEIELVTADHTAQWQTPDNYNPARPFNATLEITLAIDNNPTSTRSSPLGGIARKVTAKGSRDLRTVGQTAR